MIEKQWLSCFVSWSHELWPDNGINQANDFPLLSSNKPICLMT
jgi:hypothetical protein